MADYIDRNELVGNLDRFAHEHLTPLLRSLIEKQPTADVVEVRHGKWIEIVKDIGRGRTVTRYQCSLCDVYTAKELNYCPNCGAKMDGKDTNAMPK